MIFLPNYSVLFRPSVLWDQFSRTEKSIVILFCDIRLDIINCENVLLQLSCIDPRLVKKGT